MSAADKDFSVRRNYFIKKTYQLKFVIAFVILLVLEAILIGALFMHISGETLTSGYAGQHFVIEKTSTFFVLALTIIVFVVATAMALAGILLFIYLSHRIAGPIFRFEKTLEEVAEGDFTTRISLRKTDQLKKLQSTFNTALDKIDQKIKAIRTDLDQVEDLVSEPLNSKDSKKVAEVLARIKKTLSFFKTTP